MTDNKNYKKLYDAEEDGLYFVERAVSLYDLLQFKESKDAVVGSNKKELEKILYTIGFDVEKGYTITESIKHRANSTNQEVFCPRIEGFERSDEKWLKSGNASDDAIIGYCKDPHLRAQLKYMGRRVEHKQVEETLKANAAIYKEFEDKEKKANKTGLTNKEIKEQKQ